VDTGNIEFAALFAPKPQGMTCANDWTKEMSTKGFPELKQLYTLVGAPDKVMLQRGEHFPHNYNAVSRSAFYTWLNRHFKLGFTEPVIERDYQRVPLKQLSVWDEQYPAPKAADPDFERKLLRWFTDDAEKQIRESPDSRKIVSGAVDVLIGRNLSEVGAVDWDMKEKNDRGNYIEMSGLLRNTTHGEELPTIFFYPKQWNKQTVVWVDEAGKAGLFDSESSKPKPGIQKLLDAGATVVGVDLLYQGEFLADGKPVTQTRRVKNPREAAAFTFGYNHSLFAERVHDILTVVKFIKDSERKTELLDVVGLSGAGPWVAAARAQAQGAIDRAVIDTGGFRFGKLLEIHDVNFLPGGAKYGDLPGLLALGQPEKLLVGGEGRQLTSGAAIEWLQAKPGN
jgi:hypothetical protein